MSLQYTAIRVKDMDVSLAFYRNMGLVETGRREPIPGELVVSLEDPASKQKINLLYYAPTCKLYAPWKDDGVELDHLMFEVADATQKYNELIKNGAPVAMELGSFVRPDGNKVKMGLVKDPNGIWIGLLQFESKK